MAGGSIPPQSLPSAGPKKKIKTILPQKSLSPADDESDSDSSEEEAPGGVINDIDYEDLENFWLKDGEIESQDLSFSESRKKVCQEKRRRREGRGSTTDEEVRVEEKMEEEAGGGANGLVSPRNRTENTVPQAKVRPQPQPGVGASQSAPMIRVDYGKTMEEVSPPKTRDLTTKNTAGKSLSSTIEKLKSNLKPCRPASSGVSECGAGEVLALVLEAGMRPQEAMAILQRGWTKTEVSSQALDQVVSEVSQLRQLRSQMSPTHRQLLDQSHSAHRAAALTILSRLPPHQLQYLHSRLTETAQHWSACLERVSPDWRLTVTSPNSLTSKTFSLETDQMAVLGLADINQASVLSSKYVEHGPVPRHF